MRKPVPILQSSCCDSPIPYGKHVPFPAPISQSSCCDSPCFRKGGQRRSQGITIRFRIKRFRGTNPALLDFCFRIERHSSAFVPVKARLRPGTMPSCGIFPYSRSILFLMHVRNLYSSAETHGLAILLSRLSGIGRKPPSLSGGEARSCLGDEALQKQIPDFH